MPALVAAGIALLPVTYLAVRTAEAGAARVVDLLWRERTAVLVLRSLGLTATVTVLCLVIGVGLALLLTRTDVPGRRPLLVAAALPLAVPSYVAAYAWLSTVPAVHGFGGSVLVLTACSYPYVYLPVLAALRRVDPALEDVARSLGRGPWTTLRTVTARQVRPAAASGALLVALYTLSDFGAVSILRYDVFTRVIHSSYRASFDRTPAAVLAVLLVGLTVAITVAEARARTADVVPAASSPRPPDRLGLGAGRWPAAVAVLAVLVVSLGYPVAVLLRWLAVGLSAGPDLAALGAAASSTIWFSALGALAALALAAPVGVLAARHRGRSVRLLEQATWAGHALPGIVVALALVFLGARYAQPIYQRTPLLVLAYVVLFLPAAVGAVRAAVAMSPPAVEELARSLGSGRAEVLRRVTLPLAGPGLAAGAALVMLTCMKELPATLLLQPTGSRTLATGLWTQTGVGAYAAAAPYALALVAVAALPTLALLRSQLRDADQITTGRSRP